MTDDDDGSHWAANVSRALPLLGYPLKAQQLTASEVIPLGNEARFLLYMIKAGVQVDHVLAHIRAGNETINSYIARRQMAEKILLNEQCKTSGFTL